MKGFIILLIMTLLQVGCKKHSEPQYEGVPSTAYVVAENSDYAVLLNDEAIEDSIEGLAPIKQVSLWGYDKGKKKGEMILMSHPNADGSWFSMEHSQSIHVDSIPTIQKVIILSWTGEPLKLMVEGCPDYRNIESFIVEAGNDSAICLPASRGLIGISEEEGFLIMQSYDYYEEGGRYNIIEAFDTNGCRISSMEVCHRDR